MFNEGTKLTPRLTYLDLTLTFSTGLRRGLVMADQGLGEMPGDEEGCVVSRCENRWRQDVTECPESRWSGIDISNKRDFLCIFRID